jgi:dynein heavy chain
VRRERFIEELESYQKQVEEFATYGDMNDIQKYLRKSQNLETKLTAAAEKVGCYHTADTLRLQRNTYRITKNLFTSIKTAYGEYF